MPAQLEAIPIRRVRCTYPQCDMFFENEKEMKNHKRYSGEHDYCYKCNEDFVSYEKYMYHKITNPKAHNKACRVCGEEFKSASGLKLHIELSHKIDQQLTCVGCHKAFYRASLFIEHLEFGHCEFITASQFQGHVVHKHLITELLKGGPTYDRFLQKQTKYEAALDIEEEGGVSLTEEIFGDEEIEDVNFKAIEPADPPDAPVYLAASETFPALPSQKSGTSNPHSDLHPSFTQMSLSEKPGSSSSTPTNSGQPASSHQQLTVWGNRNGKSTSTALFPTAKPNPVLSEFSIAAYDERMHQEHEFNIMRSRFWDPMSTDWNPERFYDAVVCKYHCPFVCEQTFDCATDINKHILTEHRITRMKCPMCLKYFSSSTALMAHCESRGAKCQINKADDFNIFLDRMSGGFLGVRELVRPDHMENPVVPIENEETGRTERYEPLVASYLQYTVTKPPDWKEPVRTVKVCGGMPGRSAKKEEW